MIQNTVETDPVVTGAAQDGWAKHGGGAAVFV